jgi:hypothetical protein
VPLNKHILSFLSYGELELPEEVQDDTEDTKKIELKLEMVKTG